MIEVHALFATVRRMLAHDDDVEAEWLVEDLGDLADLPADLRAWKPAHFEAAARILRATADDFECRARIRESR